MCNQYGLCEKGHGTPSERFWKKVVKTDYCWNFTGAKTGTGLAKLWVNGGEIVASRFSWELHKGPIPKGLLVCHHCDNGICIRPNHLFLGTQKDNMQDAARKGRCVHRIVRGEEHPRHKLTWKDVESIRNVYRPRIVTRVSLSEKYKVHISTIDRVLNRERWALAPFNEGEKA